MRGEPAGVVGHVCGKTARAAQVVRQHVSFTVRGYALACQTLALVLLVASALKAQLLLNSYAPAAAMPRWSEWAIIGGEVFFAAWLLSGIAPAWSRLAAMMLLAVFVTVTGLKLVIGSADCGCFGTFQVHPALTFAFDTTALFAIYLLGRGVRVRQAPYRTSMIRRAAAAFATSVLVPVAVFALATLGRGSTDAIVLLDPGSWPGKPFPLLDFVEPLPR